MTLSKKEIVKTRLNNKGYEILDIEEFLTEHYENLETIEYNIKKFKVYEGGKNE